MTKTVTEADRDNEFGRRPDATAAPTGEREWPTGGTGARPGTEGAPGAGTEGAPGAGEPSDATEGGPEAEAHPGRTERPPASEPSGNPSEGTEASPSRPSAVPELPGPSRLLGQSFALLRAVTPDVRRGALAVGLQFLGLLGPVLVLVAAAVARLPDPMGLFGDRPATPADAELAGLVGLGILVAAAGGTALAIESRAIGLVLVAAAARGRPVSLSAALRRSRQSFWRLVVLSVAVELPLGLLGSLLGEALVGPSAGSSLLAAGLGFLAALALQVPIVYAAAGIVVGGLGVASALRESVRLVHGAPRLAPVVVVIGGAAQVLLVVALNGGLEVMAVVADLAGLGLAGDDPARTFGAIALLLGASSAVGSLLFSVSCLATAPQALVFALARPPLGLDRAAAGEAAAGSSRWLTLPMALGIATAVVVSIIGIQNVVARG